MSNLLIIFDRETGEVKSMPKAQLVDAVTNQTIAVKFLDGVTSENVKKFIKTHIPEDKRICLITDHDNAYISVVIELDFDKHQICIIHFVKIMDKKN